MFIYSNLSPVQRRMLIVDIAVYIIASKCTVRDAAYKFGVSKTTIHNYMVRELPKINYGLYSMVRDIFDTNKRERHLRGGMATKMKYFNTA